MAKDLLGLINRKKRSKRRSSQIKERLCKHISTISGGVKRDGRLILEFQ